MTIVIPALLVKIVGFYVLGFVLLGLYEYVEIPIIFVLDFMEDLVEEIKSASGHIAIFVWLLYPVFVVILFIGRVIDVCRAALSFIRRKTPEQPMPN